MESKDQSLKNEEEQSKASSSENVKENFETKETSAEQTEEGTEETTENEDSKDSPKEKELPKIDFSEMSKDDIVVQLNQIVNTFHVKDIKELFESGFMAYMNLYTKDYNEAKDKFIATGEKEEDFSYRDPSKEQMDLIEKTYKTNKHQYYKDSENRKEQNLKAKYEVIEQIKELINKDESINDTFTLFKELQKRWHEIGMVPQTNLKDLWDNYHHHVENFYDYIKINRELRDLDLKKNMQLKISLCEKAEKLSETENIPEASRELQKYHENWREIGPVPKDEKEILWTRFKKATEIINKKNHEFYTLLKEEQQAHLKAKEELCDKAEKISSEKYDSHKKWNACTEQILEIQKMWKESGPAPKKDRNKVFKRFRAACDLFFEKKKEFYFEIKNEQEKNLKIKEQLCEKAEQLKDSTDWKSTTDKLISLQKDWKKSGPVARKVSDKIWGRFRAACDAFFDAKDAHFADADKQYEGNLQLKLDIIKELENFEASEKEDETIERLSNLQNKWVEIGFVPLASKNEINEKFQNLLNNEFDKLELDTLSLNVQRFKAKIDSYFHGEKSERKILHEREKLVSKIKTAEQETATLENNMGFLSGSKGSGLLKDLQDKVDKSKESVKLLKAKLKVIDNLL